MPLTQCLEPLVGCRPILYPISIYELFSALTFSQEWFPVLSVDDHH